MTLSLIFGAKNGYFQFVTVELSLFKVKTTFIVQAKREREIYMKVVQDLRILRGRERERDTDRDRLRRGGTDRDKQDTYRDG